MLIEITLLAGRTDAQKQVLFNEVTAAAAVSLGVDAREVRVAIQDVPLQHFAVGGVPKAPFPAARCEQHIRTANTSPCPSSK